MAISLSEGSGLYLQVPHRARIMRPTEKQSLALLELNRGSKFLFNKTQKGRRVARWINWRGNMRAGKLTVGTARAILKRQWAEPEDIGKGTYRISELGMEAAIDAMELLGSGVFEKRRKVKVTANDVLDALEGYYSQSGLVVVREVSIAYKGERRVDALVLGRGNETAIFAEVKVSRQDFTHELDDTDKRQMALDLGSQYYFAAQVGLIKPDEIPPECGLLEMGIDGKIGVTVEAPHSRPAPPDWRLVSAVARALKR